jgi:hypothetical protein
MAYYDGTEYSRRLENFLGVDFSSGQPDRRRFTYLKNMYRDYDSELGDAVETVPGFRLINKWAGKINGLYAYKPAGGDLHIMVHSGTKLYEYKHSDRDDIADDDELIEEYTGLANAKSQGLMFNNRLYILDGTNYWVFNGTALAKVTAEPYLPITYVNGEEYEQRNMLLDQTINRDTQMTAIDIRNKQIYHGDEAYLVNVMEDLIKPATTLHLVNGVGSPGFVARAFEGTDIEEVRFHGSYNSEYGTLDGTFKNCTSLKTLYLGNLVWDNLKVEYDGKTPITEWAFTGCTALEKVYTSYSDAQWLEEETHIEDVFPGMTIVYSTPTPAGFITPNMAGSSPDPVVYESVVYDMADSVDNVKVDGEETENYGVIYHTLPISVMNPKQLFDKNTCNYLNGYLIASGGTIEPISTYGYTQAYTAVLPETKYNLRGNLSGTSAYSVFIACYNASYTFLERFTASGNSVTFTTPANTAYIRIVTYTANTDLDTWLLTLYADIDEPLYLDEGLFVDKVIAPEDWRDNDVDITLNCVPGEFNTVAGYLNIYQAMPEYSGTAIDAIEKCTLIESFDGRLFFTGNPNLPNTVFYTQRDLTGYSNPTYVGILNYVNDGVGMEVNKAMMSTPHMLMVLKGDTVEDGSVFYHAGADTGSNIIPRTYPSQQGVAGIGCTGAACNFRDDPVFLSKYGLEAVGKEQVNLERTITHRSSYVDRLLRSEDLADSIMVEWMNYLCIFCPSGSVYMADSKQFYNGEYEWYYMDDVGAYAGQTQNYKLTTGMIEVTDGDTTEWLSEAWVVHEGTRKRIYVSDTFGFVPYADVYSSYLYKAETGAGTWNIGEVESVNFCEVDGVLYLCEPDEEAPYIGGTFKETTAALVVGKELYFGTSDGDLLCFNSDKRGVAYGGVTPPEGTLHPHWYTFNGRTIECALTTAYDSAGYPDLAKSTVSKSLVVHTKTYATSQFDLYVRTDRTDAWKYLGRKHNSTLQFNLINFGNVALKISNEGIATIREHERRWAKKQYYMESKEHMCPFGLYHMGYRFSVTGRIRA